MEKKTGELLFVLEDQRKPLERLMTANPEFKKKFSSKLELPVFINDELVTFGQTYAKENGYKLDEMGIVHTCFSDVEPDPSLASAKAGAAARRTVHCGRLPADDERRRTDLLCGKGALMIKVLFAGVLPLVLIGLCAWNLRYLSRMRTQLDEAVAQAEASCAAGDPARASETLRAASARWSEAEDYAHCMLPHESTDAVTEGFRRAIRTVETGDPSAAADIALLHVRIQGRADGERITLGNIF